MKRILLDINNAYIFFCASLYVGLFWSLHFFWFPHYPSTLNLENYYDAIIPQTTTATKFFFVTIPIMAVSIIIMLITEWKTKLRWVPIGWLFGLFAPVIIQQVYIERINNEFKAGVSDMATLQDLLQEWMFLNDLRGVILTLAWCMMMYFYIAKSRNATTI